MASVEVNKLSKIYNQNSKSNQIFNNTLHAKQFFLTDKAIETFDKFCYRQRFRLTDDKKSLHWTISFELLTTNDPNYIPNSDLWRDSKSSITSEDKWFQHPNHPIIKHDAEHLF
ncbi:MAG: hypothetical protein CBC16_09660 [Verrucomicrobia bacterium TMED56]|nr:MAG: hypothetical protein CBC16_09660 [Verrucomicrobia bacterium TMED56]|tara:strand:+ start:686 stop:1027 length:342 start_codon:yes stop_codon:yes gene_type:complete